MALTPAEVQKNLHKLAPFSQERIEQLHAIERQAIASFTGQFDELEAALGMLHLGDHLGWKPLVLIHNKRTIRKYEEILGINIREFFPEEGPSAERSMGYSHRQEDRQLLEGRQRRDQERRIESAAPRSCITGN